MHKSTRFCLNSFRYQAAKPWNALPDDARKITDLTHSEPSSRLGVMTSVGVLCAGNAASLCSWGPR